MANVLSYRIGHPAKPQLALDRVKALGIPCVEINLGPEEDPQPAKALLASHGLRAATLTAPCPLADARLFDIFDNYCAKAAALGCSGIFTSVHAGQMPLEEAYARLRKIGDIGARNHVKIGMETHPDLCENGSKAAASMAAVGHPWVGINYDTANVYYYNHGINTVEEVAKEAQYVVSVHLKDTMGGYHDGNFPDFGKGVVDFAGVFKVLNDIGFTGPFTMELEGAGTTSSDPAAQEAHVRACVEHLRALGLVP
ncbi:MAG TPA: sugar phosphate isomerase/epimerase family protein [Planctomycetota bacterium]|nr:sugar phosphate isomerase/epimerase family protein [Planctomycetota bacterium]